MVVKKRFFMGNDVSWVRSYIERKFGLIKTWPNETQRQDAFTAFETIGTGPDEGREIYLWCRLWLSPAQWKTLRSSLGAWRCRYNNPDKVQKRIFIDYDSWLYLTSLAKHEGITVSEFVKDRFGEEYSKVFGGKE